ncbi:MAG: hypothetical protein II565_13920 [Fibrobacter sp.]|jgi:F0F1-type ATP synthase membrane subunit c/vacuolar-type H+-ATPase subunit K|nr:hypothetical protein [Fibrobacter sp.]MBQ5464913.1 hypothetical protein [Fibrobacter sp.]
MICKKCGKEYEDDMPSCLWCDAPNEEHPNFTKRQPLEEHAKTEDVPPETAEPSNNRVAGSFMWSCMIFNCSGFGYIYVSIIQTLLHYKELHKGKVALRFFIGMLLANLALYFITLPVINVLVKATNSTLVNLGIGLAYAIVQGVIGAKLVNFYAPNYDKSEYRKKEHIAIAIAIVVFIITVIVLMNKQ